MRPLAYIIMVLLMGGCTHREPGHFTHEVLNRMTPVKNRGESDLLDLCHAGRHRDGASQLG